MTEFSRPLPDLALRLVVAVVVALVIGQLIRLLVRRPARHHPVVADMSRRGHRPFQLALGLGAVALVLDRTAPGSDVPGALAHVVRLGVIAVIGWLVAVLAFVVEDLALARYRVDVADNRRARRVRTQVSILRRLTLVVVVVVGGASMLLTYPSARAAGTSLLASAGLLSVVAGLAAQTSLANVFAGLQLAFTDAMRVDDVVVVEREWGRIEEITLTYVVVHIWDDRRLVMPSTYFTTTPFENWTRRDADLLGTVEFDVDWTTPFDGMRDELARVVDGTPLWDGRVAIVQVTDAVSSFVHVRVLLSAPDAPTMFDLRCHVREALVRWLASEHPESLPHVRTEQAGRPTTSRFGGLRRSHVDASTDDGRPTSSLFTGPDGAERYRAFAGQGVDPEDDRTRVAVEELAALDGADSSVLPASSRQAQQPG